MDPAILTDSAPGDLFVVRNVASLVPPYETTGRYHGTSAALEFAVCNLHVHNIIVLGHSHCGGIHALLDGYGENDEGEGYIAPWVRIAAPPAMRCCGAGRMPVANSSSGPANGLGCELR